MSCPTELTLSIYADNELPREEAHRVATHLEGCVRCTALLEALEQENVVLMQALGEAAVSEEKAPTVSLVDAPAATAASVSGWVWGATAAAAMAPLMLDWVWQAMPSLPVGLRWLGNFGGLSGAYSLSGGFVSLIVGGQDMLVSSFGFAVTLVVVVGVLGALALRRPLAGVGATTLVALLATLAPPGTASAAEFRYEEEGTVKVDAGESIDDTVFLGGKTAIVAGVVDGDVFAAAERVDVTGTVRGNLYSAGETVNVAGEVSGNVHAVGKSVDVDAKVGGSGFLAGQNVTLEQGGKLLHSGFLAGESVWSKGTIGRDAYVAGEKIELSGTVARSLRGIGSEFAMTSSGAIGGDLQLKMPAEDAVAIDDGGTVGGETTVELYEKEERRAFLYPGFYFGVLAKTLALLVIGLVLVTLFPSLRPPSPESSREVLRDMGIGFVTLVATPLVMVLVALTVIGIPVSVVLGMAYLLLLYLSTLVVAYFAAQRLAPSDNRRLVLWTGFSLLVILFVVEIPFVGGGLGFLIRIFGMGCLAWHVWQLYRAGRGPTDMPLRETDGALAT